MSTFSAVLSALGLAPKTLPQANETLTQAKATLDSVAALFTAAGLNLEQMLAAGPDALKAHLDSLDNSDELATVLQENETLSARAIKLDGEVIELSGIVQHITTAIALPVAKDAKAADIKGAFDSHVSKQTTLALAKAGHPPAHVPAADVAPVAKPTGAELHATWKAMKPSAERLAFFIAHEAEITAFERNGPK